MQETPHFGRGAVSETAHQTAIDTTEAVSVRRRSRGASTRLATCLLVVHVSWCSALGHLLLPNLA